VDDAPRDADPASPSGGRLSETSSVSSSSVVLPGQSDASHKAGRKKPTYWQSVASIGVQVAQALEHAHSQGILHRDVKPSNLLLDLRGCVWVTDFGLAKADDQQDLTHTGDILGTLRYMPPEAFEGRTDRRGDIYSLGLTLYELLALRPAFAEKDRHRLIKRVTTEEPERLDRLNPQVPRDLVTIVHKAIDRDFGHRYASAADLAADLQRFVNDEPIQARRVTLRERGWRWCRHNPALASMTATAVALLVAGLIILAVSNATIIRQKNETEVALQEKDIALREARANKEVGDEERQRAEENLKVAIEVLDEIVMKEAEKQLSHYLQTTDTALLQDGLGELFEDSSRARLDRELLQKGVTFYERFAQRNGTTPAAQLESARAYRRVGSIRVELRQWPEAEESFRKAIVLLEKLAEAHPDVWDYQRELAQAYYWLTIAQPNGLIHGPGATTARTQEAEATCRQALALSERLVAKFPEKPDYRLELAHCNHRAGELLMAIGQTQRAEQAFRRALALKAEVAKGSPQNPDYRSNLAHGHARLGGLLVDTNRPAEAEQAYRAALGIREDLAIAFPNNAVYRWDVAHSHMMLGDVLQRRGRFQDAEQAYRSARQGAEKLVTEDVQENFLSKPARLRLAAELNGSLGTILKNTGQPQDAVKTFRHAVDYYEKLAADYPRVPHYRDRLTVHYTTLANLLGSIHQRQEGKEAFDKAREHARRLLEISPYNPGPLNSAAWHLVAWLDPPSREAGLLAITLAEAALAQVPDDGLIVNTLGTALYRAGEWKGAIKVLKESDALRHGDNFSFNAFFIAMAHWQRGEKEQARRWYALARVWMEKYAPNNEELRRFRTEAAKLLTLPEQLSPDQERAKADDLQFYSLVLEAHPKAAWAYKQRGVALTKCGQEADARADLKTASELEMEDPKVSWARGRDFAKQGRWQEAATAIDRVLKSNPSHHYAWYVSAPLRLEVGDVKGYRQLCREMLDRFGKTQNPRIAERTAKAALLLPAASDELDLPAELAERGLLADAAGGLRPYAELAKGLAEYRQANFTAADQRVSKLVVAEGAGWNLIVPAQLVLAMTRQKQGQTEKARASLARAIEIMNQRVPNLAAAGEESWHDWLICRVLHREAEALLGGTAPEPKK
jgi:tetratricopeptide (TPR) repeat protein